MNVVAQTLSSHIEMIAPGVMGINFMKPEKPINTMSEVYKLVQEEEQFKAKSPTPSSGTMSPIFKPTKVPPVVAPKPKPTPVVNASVPFSPPAPKSPKSVTPTDGPQHGPCNDCGRMIIGPYVGLSDRNLHEECFKCSTCGASLKNIGFHNISGKLYCDMHAKLAAKVIAGASSPAPAPAPAPVFKPVSPTPKPLPTMQAKPVQSSIPPLVPPIPTVQSSPASYAHQSRENLPLSPSSSGNLTFRSISPQPWKRLSGDYHKVVAPTSPPPGHRTSSPTHYSSSGPLPFEMKPYMPPDQSSLSLFSTSSSSSEMTSTQTTEISKTTQVVQRTTQMSQQQIALAQQQHQQQQQQQQNQHIIDYRQVIGGQQKTKFIWPPPKPQYEVDGVVSASATAPSQNYSPLVTQSTPAYSALPQKYEAPAAYRSVQPPVQSQPEPAPPMPTPPSTFTVPPLPTTTFPVPPLPTTTFPVPPLPTTTFPVPPLPTTTFPAPPLPTTTFSAQPIQVEENADTSAQTAPSEPKKEEPISSVAPPPPAPSSGAQTFAPVLPPIVDIKTQSTPAQPGVPTGAGSRPAPKKGRGQMKEQTPGRIPICADCGEPIRGPFIIALTRTWCPNHFHCNNLHCKTPLIDVGFVEEQGQLYCEYCYEAFLAPICNKCNVRIKGDCLNALDKQWHPECFICAYCHKPFGNNSFYLEDGLPYCEKDWNELFTTKCVGCGFPIEAGDRWVEALNNNYHSQCFKCSICNKNLEGQSFYAKGGRPFCKAHAR